MRKASGMKQFYNRQMQMGENDIKASKINGG